MSPDISSFIPLFLIMPLLVGMAFNDLKNLRISNRLVGTMLLVFALSAPFVLPPPEIGNRLVAGAGVFAIGFAGFACRLWGGGDVKAMTALTLFIPSAYLPLFGLAFSFAMALGMVMVLTTRRVFGTPDNSWCAMRPGAEFPMGVSIAMSGLLVPLVLKDLFF